MNHPTNGSNGMTSVAQATGIGRKVDDLGRIVLPVELRRAFDIREGDLLDVATDDQRIVLTKRQETCTFCNSLDDLKTFRDRRICETCHAEIIRI